MRSVVGGFLVGMFFLSFYSLVSIPDRMREKDEPEPQTEVERKAAYDRGPKYRDANEYTLKNGCRFRNTQGEMFVRDQKDRRFKWMLVVNQPLNEWTKECSAMPKFFAREEDVAKVRYK